MTAAVASVAGTTVGSGRWLRALAGAAVAAAVLWVAVAAHLKQACTVMDTPYLPLCPEPSAIPEEVADQLRERIRRNPGDSWAWTRLLVAQRDEPAAGVLQGAATLAPNHSNVLRWRAVAAFERGDLPQGVALLIQILQYRNSAEAATLVAQLAVSPQGIELLRPHLPRAKEWLPKVLATMAAQKMPTSEALPLVVEAMRHGGVPDAARRTYMRSLKAGGHWHDAYGLWLAQHRKEVPLLYNGGFDQSFQPEGFDWEFTPVIRSKAGVVIAQQAVARRGLVLDLEFTGRRFTSPLLRQFVFAPPGPYVLRGEYMASKLRSEGGLAWRVVCVGSRRPVPITSSPLVDTGGVWKKVEAEFTIPADCGPVASLQLEPTAAFEAAAGIKGRVEIDGFTLTRAGN